MILSKVKTGIFLVKHFYSIELENELDNTWLGQQSWPQTPNWFGKAAKKGQDLDYGFCAR